MRLPFFYGWVMVACTFVTMGIGVNARTAFSLLFPPILDEFHWDRGVTAGAFSFGFLASAVFGPFIGRLLDRRGPRVVIELGVVLVAAGLALAPLAREPWHLYLSLGFLVGSGTMCLGYTGQSLFLPNWFVRRRGLAMGVAFSGVGVGSIVLLPWVQSLIVRSGWRSACLALAILALAVLAPLNLLLRKRPEDLGLAPDGEAAVPAGAVAPDGEAAVPAVAAAASGGAAAAPGARRAAAPPANVVDPAWAAVDWTLGRAMGTTRFWWVALGFAAGMFAWYVVQIHQTKYLIDTGFSPTLAAWALGLVSLAGIPGQIALGHVSDRIGREWVWTLGSLGFVLCYLVLLALPHHPTPALLYLMVACQGMLGYGVTSVFPAVPAELFQGRHYGTIFGTLSLASLVGGALGPWAAGAIYDVTGSYAIAFWLAIGASVVSAVAIWLAAPRKVRAVAGRVHRIAARA